MGKRLYSTAELIQALKSMSAAGLSWGEIAHQLYPLEDQEKIRPILWRMVHDGYYPKSNKLRSRLNLTLLKEVEACPECNEIHTARCPKIESGDLPSFKNIVYVEVVGNIPEGAQIGGIALVCVECGQLFIPNHPRRRKCFICSPYRGVRK